MANLCKKHGYKDARRSQQYCGDAGDSDVVGFPGLFVEVKRVQKLNIENAMTKADEQAIDNEIPVVAHRKDNKKWQVTMMADDWFKMYKEWESKFEKN